METYPIYIKDTRGKSRRHDVLGRDMSLPGWAILYVEDKGSPSGQSAIYMNKDSVREVKVPLFPVDAEEEREEDE